MTDTASSDLVAFGEQSIAKGSKSFGMAAKLFRPEIRADVVMLYAWCRHADDLIDGQEFGFGQDENHRDGQHARLAELKAKTATALRGEQVDDPAFDVLVEVTQNNEIPARHPQELIDGFEMDVNERDYATLEDTLDYCYHVAGVVGVMMAMVMGVRKAAVLDRASDLGLAFQLTNIARDIIDDAGVGRRYLPADLLGRHGLTVDSFAAPENRPALHAAACDQLDAAERYYASARWGLPALDWRSAWAIASAARVYRAIGQKLRRTGPAAWDRRISTGTFTKLGLVVLALGDVIRSRFRDEADGPARTGLYKRPTG